MIPQVFRSRLRKAAYRSTTRHFVRRRKWPWSFERLEDRALLATLAADSGAVTEGAFPPHVAGNVLVNDSDPDGPLSVSSVSFGGGAPITVPAAAATRTIDFETLAHNEFFALNTITHGSAVLYLEDGFTINGHGSSLHRFGTGDFRFTGSTALFNVGSTASLSLSSGGPFSLQSIDLAELDSGTGALTVTYTGHKAAGGTVSQNFTLDGLAFGAQTFLFSSDFTNLVSVSWTPNGAQYDNIVATVGETVVAGQYGSLAINANGGYAYRLNSAHPLVDALGPGQSLNEVFTYTAGSTASANLTVNINGVNDAPVANAQVVTTHEDEAVNITLIGTDIDSAVLNFSIASSPAHGALSGTAPNLTFTPNVNYNGSDSFTFTVSDGLATSAPATVSITVNAVDDAPTLGADSGTVTEGAFPPHVAGNVLVNDSDPDGPLSVSSVSFGGGAPITVPAAAATRTIDFETLAHNEFFALNTITHGSAVLYLEDGFTINGHGSSLHRFGTGDFRFTGSTALFNVGSTASLSLSSGGPFSLQSIDLAELDSGTGALTVTYTGHKAAGGTVSQNFTLDGLAFGAQTFLFSSDFTNLVSVSWTPNGAQYDNIVATVGETVVAGQYGSLAINANGGYAYRLNSAHPLVDALGPGQSLNEVFTYTAGSTASANLTVNINGVNDPPVLVTNVGLSVAARALITDGLLRVTDVDNAPAHVVYTVTAVPANGTLRVNGTTLPLNGTFTQFDISAGRVTYLFGGGATSDSFSFTVSDGAGGSIGLTTFNISIAPNDPPVADPQVVTTQEEEPIGIALGGSDANGDILTFSITSQPAHGTLTGTVPDIIYSPNLNYHGSDSFTFTVSDGLATSSVATVSITVLAVNDAPVANNQSVVTAEDTAKAITLVASDIDIDPLSFTIVTPPTHGTLSGTAPDLTYTPAPDYDGPDSFTFKANDGQADSNIATVSINVTSVTDTFVVDTLIDETDGDYSPGNFALREAILRVNAGPGLDNIEFAPTLAGTITLTNGELTVSSDMTMTGPGADQLAVSGNSASRVFKIVSGTSVAISGLTIRNGSTSESGGGIHNSGVTTISDSTISGNSASGSAPFNLNVRGGGIFNNGGTLTVTNSTISGNQVNTGSGGGIGNNGGTLTVLNSTISGNSASGFGGGNNGGGIFNQSGTLTITHSTISGNSASGLGGGIRNGGGLIIQNTIIAGNTSTNGPDVHGGANSLGNNLIGNTTASSGWITSDLQNVDARLGPLADNGGPTTTHALLGGSPAIDGGNNTGAPATDQRGSGFPRVLDGDNDPTATIDIGAYEAAYTPQSYMVDTAVDENDADYSAGDLSLREAIALANTNVGADTIMFNGALASPTITVGLGELVIHDDLTISGPGADQLAVSGNSASRVFKIVSGTSVAISGLTIRNGSTSESGGGIHNSGVTTISDSTISGNSASGSAPFNLNVRGGGIFNNGGTLTVTNSTISGNQVNTGSGGGIGNNGGTLTVLNSTISGNSASGFGGGNNGGGIFNQSGTLTITHSTISGNSASGLGGGIRNGGGLIIQNTIIAGNTSTNGPDVHGGANSLGNNLIGNTTASSGWITSDLQNVDARLGPLADNGGPTTTHALLAGSPAIDAGSNADAPATDQRGFTRIADGADANTTQTIDIGAFEAHPSVENIPDKSTNEDTPLSFSFSVGDAALGIDSVTATSSNAALVPNTAANLNLGGSGGTRTLSITPSAGESGTSTITVTVTAGGQSMTDTFVLTVNAVNDVPVANPQTITTDEDEAVSVTLSGSDANGDALTFSITAQPLHGTLSGTAPNLIYAPDLNYHGPDAFDFTVSDGQATSAAATVSITVLSINDAPVADANGPYETNLGEPITLDGAASFDVDEANGDSIVSYAWDIGGGTITLSGEAPTVSAAQIDQLGVGSFTVGLIVTDEFGLTGTATSSLSIYDNRPFASFAANPNPGAPNQAINFNAGASSHGHPDRQIVSYEWDFGDGSTASGVSVTHAYAAFGSYTVTLTVTDDNNPAKTATSSTTVNVNLGNLPPVADANGPYIADLGGGVNLDASGSADPNAAAGDNIVSYSWNIGGGALTLSGVMPSLSAAQVDGLGVGTFDVALTVTDEFGATDTDMTNLSIFDNRPFAVLGAIPTSTAPGQPVAFDASASSHGHPDRSIVQYDFDFGDGSSYSETSDSAPDGLFDGKTTHAYGLFDTFTAGVTVTDDNVPAKTASASTTIGITEGNHAPVADPGGPYDAALGSGVTLDGSGSFDPDAAAGDSIVSYSWEIGGGVLTLSGVMPSLTEAQLATLGDGTFAVALTVTDEFGLTGSASTTLFRDTTPPTLTGPGPLTVEATGPTGGIVNYNVVVSDNLDSAPTVVSVPASGSIFAIGQTTVTVTATDASDNSAQIQFVLSVVDTTPPALTVPADISAEAASGAGTIVTFAGTATDAVDPQPTINYSHASGSLFALGETTITVTATDDAGNVANETFKVFVIDTTGPAITLPPDQTFEATSAAGAIVTFIGATTPGETTTITYSPTNGSQFLLGMTTVLVTATDPAGNSSTGTFRVFVLDTTPPVLMAPADITVEATSPAGATATFAAIATDTVDPQPVITYSRTSGSQFAIGDTTVTATATDGAGNSSQVSFEISVLDTTAPVLTVPADITLDATSAAGAVVTFAATATDIVDPQPTISFSHSSGSLFPIGVTVVTVTAIDDAGNQSTGDFTVTVVDTTPSGGLTTVNVISGQLVIGGDGGDDIVSITGIGTGTGVYTITTAQGTQTISGVTGGISINLGSGNDSLVLNNVYVAGAIDIQTGDGNDTLVLGNNDVVSSGGELRIDLGAGDDTLDGKRLYIGTNQIINAGDGNDRLIFDGFATPQFTLGTSAAGNATWIGGAGNDVVHVVYGFIVGGWIIELGAGSDTFDVFGSAASGDVQIFGRGGNDWLRVETNFFDANLVMEGNDGGGLLFLANGLGTEAAILSAGNGDDAVTVRNQTTSRLQIETGAGGDSVDVRASALDRLFAQLGDGNDRLTVHGNLSRFETRFDGSLGNGDLLLDLGNSFQSIYDKLGFEGFG